MRVKIKTWEKMEDNCVYINQGNLHLVDDTIFTKDMEDNIPKSRWIDIDSCGIWLCGNVRYYVSEEMIEYNLGIDREDIEKFLYKT